MNDLGRERRVIVLGARQRLGAAISHCCTEMGFRVENDLAQLDADPGPAPYAIILVPPVLIYDHGPRRDLRVAVDVFDTDNPDAQGRLVRPHAKLADSGLRRGVEAMALPGTRVAIVSPSLYLDSHRTPPSWLEDAFGPHELPLLLHAQAFIVEKELPDIWSISLLPSGTRSGRGCGFDSIVHPSSWAELRARPLHDIASDVVQHLGSLRFDDAHGLVAGESPAF